MQITWLGYLLLPLGMVLFVVSPIWVYSIAIFSIPFTTTSLLNSRAGVPVTVLHYYAALIIINQVVIFLITLRWKYNLYGDKSLFLLILFASIVILSLIMPLIIDGRLMVSTNQLNDLYEVPLQLTKENATNIIYVVFGVMLSISLILWNDSIDKLRFTIKIYVVSGVFVSLWAYLQFMCNNVLGIEYPYYIFNTAVAEAMQGYTQTFDFEGEFIPRVSSVAHEPSIFAKYLLTVIPVMVVFVLMKRRLFGGSRDKLVLLVLVGALLITTSASAYLGLVCISVVTATLMGRYRSGVRHWIIGLGLVSIIVGLTYAWFPEFQEMFDAMLFTKYDSGSATERLLSVTTSWEYFLMYPILGVGWAMVTCHDLIVNLLVSTGVVGLATFGLLILSVIRRSILTLDLCTNRGDVKHNDLLVLTAGLLISFITLILMGIVTGLEFYLGFLYFIIGMLIATNIVARAQYCTETK